MGRGGRVQRETGTKYGLHRRKKEGFVLDLNNGTRGFLRAIDEITLFSSQCVLEAQNVLIYVVHFFLTD